MANGANLSDDSSGSGFTDDSWFIGYMGVLGSEGGYGVTDDDLVATCGEIWGYGYNES